MTFEEFEKKILEKGYGIVAMNHYAKDGKRHLYCVVLGKNENEAIMEEAEHSKTVFENICKKMDEYEN